MMYIVYHNIYLYKLVLIAKTLAQIRRGLSLLKLLISNCLLIEQCSTWTDRNIEYEPDDQQYCPTDKECYRIR